MSKAKYQEALKFYDQLVATNPNFERKGKTMPYTSANGYMFSQLNKDGQIGIRLPKELAKKFMETHEGAGPFRSYGAVMKDYVLVPDHLHGNIEILSEYLEQSHQYVLSLPPK